MAEKTRYSDEELEEFRQIINEKMALAKRIPTMWMTRRLHTRHLRKVAPLSRKKKSSVWLQGSRNSFRD